MPQPPDAPDGDERPRDDVPPDGTAAPSEPDSTGAVARPAETSAPPPARGAEPPPPADVATGAAPPPAMGSEASRPPTPQPSGSGGAGVGVGVALGCVVHIIGFVAMIGSVLSAMGIWGALWPFYVIGVAAIVGMFFPASRRVSTGVLIVSAATWIILLGPCVASLGRFG